MDLGLGFEFRKIWVWVGFRVKVGGWGYGFQGWVKVMEVREVEVGRAWWLVEDERR